MFDRPSPGYTLVELVSVLVLLAVGASAFAPTARRFAERATVLSAREEVVRSLGRARAAAVSYGGASVTIRARPPSVRISAGGRVMRDVAIGDGHLEMELSGGGDSTTLRFGPLGIGRFSNGSVTLRRGGVEAGLVVSSYGRVRRR